ncbi:MAG: regulatory protein RecX [bacterium]|nr:regulatory protein RecX [bacterium]
MSRRSHFRRELEQKLLMRDFSAEEVEAALDRATERGFLNDLECARELARLRVERRHEGPAKLFATLTRRGSDSGTARRVVAEHYADGEQEQLRQAASLWLNRNSWDRDRLARHLKGKGFSGGAILSALERTEALVDGEAS